ncbi:hydroxymethylbilane synthase [Hydrogenoanaerobacterium sp.]|uniref:hydroxymethylbilane synthase n=1 Tax=Hydrogenoanaerobacterium sp. TaxID=2953763 RepID=UPI0028995637|nr:hydroxymethylbilane synthase [Hydrogenoanaerobacterium sp.]
MEKRKIIVGSRESRLAVAQTQLVMDAIAAAHPDLELQLVTMKTTGDIILDKSLDKIGGKGLFVKELDRALREHKVDITVHSLKDMPMDTPDDLPIVAFSKRGDPSDAFILPYGTEKLDETKPIGCGSARRVLQLKKLYPNMQTKLIRGNILTRLAKLDAGEYSALVLACSGLNRVDLGYRISRIFSNKEMLPAAGQGILAVQGRAGENYDFLDCVNDKQAQRAALAERAFVRVLDGGCSSPIAAHAELTGESMKLTGLYYEEQTGRHIIGSVTGHADNGEQLGADLANRLKEEILR